MLGSIETPIRKITTDEIRGYLVDYQKVNNCSKVTVDNVRRNMSSFFSWLEEEDYLYNVFIIYRQDKGEEVEDHE